jgi:hypothetical protein
MRKMEVQRKSASGIERRAPANRCECLGREGGIRHATSVPTDRMYRHARYDLRDPGTRIRARHTVCTRCPLQSSLPRPWHVRKSHRRPKNQAHPASLRTAYLCRQFLEHALFSGELIWAEREQQSCLLKKLLV